MDTWLGSEFDAVTAMAQLSGEKQRRSTVLDEDIHMLMASPKHQMLWLSSQKKC